MINIETDGSKIVLRGWAGVRTPSLCKSVDGARFSKTDDDPRWTFPRTWGACLQLRKAFGTDLEIGPVLTDWARAEKAAQAELAALAQASDAELRYLPELAPGIDALMANRSYQRAVVAFGARAGSFGNFSQPGLGKTLETIAAIIESNPEGGAHLIFTPKIAVDTVWGPELASRFPEASVLLLLGSNAKRESLLNDEIEHGAYAKHTFVVSNIESVRISPHFDDDDPDHKKPKFDVRDSLVPSLFSLQWTTIVVDETHRALIRTSGTPTQMRAGFVKLRGRRRIALSGTPMRGKPEQLWGTLNWLYPDVYTSYWKWIARYFELSNDGFSSYVIGSFLPGGEERLYADIKGIVIRHTKAEVLKELPPKQYVGTSLLPGVEGAPFGVWGSLEGKQKSQYLALEKDAAVAGENGDVLIANGRLAWDTRRKQFANSSGKVLPDNRFAPTLPSWKFDWTVQKINELGILDGEDERIVIASQFTELIDLWERELNALDIKTHKVTGAVSNGNRKAAVADFQSDNPKARVFLINTIAGGVAITLDKADHLVVLDETYIPDEQEQVEDRVHRTSRIHAVWIYYLRTLGTIQEEIAWVTAAREDVQKYLLDGVRGISHARSLFEAKA